MLRILEDSEVSPVPNVMLGTSACQQASDHQAGETVDWLGRNAR
jgi:hypothetical protein